MLIDTHTHLYLEEFEDDIDDVIRRAVEAGVERMLMPNIDSSTIQAMNDLVTRYPQNCLPMIGLHPCSVKGDWEEELERIDPTPGPSPKGGGASHASEEGHGSDRGPQRSEAGGRRHRKEGLGGYVAIGETGLDYYWDRTFIEEQKQALKIQIGWAKEMGIPIVLHSRESFDDLADLMERHHGGSLSGVFHCFTGSVDDAKRVIALPNFYLGIGGVVTYKNTALRETLAVVGLDRVVLETDSPYLAPVPYRGKRNESSYLSVIAGQVAEAIGATPEHVAETTTRNARQLFGVS